PSGGCGRNPASPSAARRSRITIRLVTPAGNPPNDGRRCSSRRARRSSRAGRTLPTPNAAGALTPQPQRSGLSPRQDLLNQDLLNQDLANQVLANQVLVKNLLMRESLRSG